MQKASHPPLLFRYRRPRPYRDADRLGWPRHSHPLLPRVRSRPHRIQSADGAVHSSAAPSPLQADRIAGLPCQSDGEPRPAPQWPALHRSLATRWRAALLRCTSSFSPVLWDFFFFPYDTQALSRKGIAVSNQRWMSCDFDRLFSWPSI